MQAQERYNLGGVMLPQPFRIRRLGHFGLNVDDTQACLDFYCNTLGFRLSDPEDLALRHPDGAKLKEIGDTRLYFTRHGTDHHSFVFGDRRVFNAMGRGARLPEDVTVNQLTWQVGSLAEVSGGIDYFKQKDVPINRVGRDMPGSNWHVYPYDPEGHRNELYYGMEQIGWNNSSKPKDAHARGFRERPSLPQMPEHQEVDRLRENGVDLDSGHRPKEILPLQYDVDGILLARPFKIVRHGPVKLFCKDMVAMEHFYTRIMGLQVTEEVLFEGQRCVYLRCNSEHHSLALMPIALRERLGLQPGSTTMSFGVQLGSYRQLRDAVAFLEQRGAQVFMLPAELSPGIEHSYHVRDSAGHAVQLYWTMEQVGWDGRPRPRRQPMNQPPAQWPETVDGQSDSYMGEPFLGPWA